MSSELRNVHDLMNPIEHPVHRATYDAPHMYAFSRPIIKVDYHKTIEDVCFQLAKNIIAQTGLLKILSAVQYGPGSVNLEEACPSCVPRRDIKAIHHYLGLQAAPFNIWRANEDQSTARSELKVDGNALISPGIWLDVITASTEPITKDSLRLPQSEQLDFWRTLVTWDLSPKYTVPLEAYKRAFTADCLLTRYVLNPIYGPEPNDPSFDDFVAFWMLVLNEFFRAKDASCGLKACAMVDLDEFQKSVKRGKPHRFWREAESISRHCRVFLSSQGLLGLGPSILEPGDCVVLLFAARVPFVLRPKDDHWLLAGECYVDGIMNGEEEFDTSLESLFKIH